MRQPEGNGCSERFIRTLKEQLLWVRSFETAEELRLALRDWAEMYKSGSSVGMDTARSTRPGRCSCLSPRWRDEHQTGVSETGGDTGSRFRLVVVAHGVISKLFVL
jgi:hypothetical protein